MREGQCSYKIANSKHNDPSSARYFHRKTGISVQCVEDEDPLAEDFSKWSFGVVFVESDEHNYFKNISIRILLEKNGYMNENFGGKFCSISLL